MHRQSCIAFLLLSVTALLGASAIYRSNDFGMQLEPIASWQRGGLKWVLEVSVTPRGEVRRLFQDGKETKRWEMSRLGDGRSEERELDGSSPAARRLYAPNGDLLEEDQYSKGKLTQKSLYTYASSRVVRVRVLAADGALLYNKDYFYTSRGSLREVRETGGAADARVSAFVAGRSGLSEEWNRNGDDLFVARFDQRGRTVESEHHKGKDLISREDLVYEGDTDKLRSSVEKLPLEGKIITSNYDSQGGLQTQTVSAGGKVVEEIGYGRDDKGRALRKSRRSAAGLEEWRYTLDQAGKTVREEFFRRGSLEKVTLFGDNDSRTEELYQGGALFMKVYYEGDRRSREEVYVDGKIARERSFK